MAIIGIDLGTTNSMVARYTEDGPQLVPTATGGLVTASIVAVGDDGELIVGEAARHRLVTDPARTASMFKRNMGAEKLFQLGDHALGPADLSALVLKSLREDVERETGEPVTSAVISVPAYFNDVQRKATFDAARIAGLPVERLVNEPTAASLAYGVSVEDEDVTYLIADLGGGTFDVSILNAFHGIMEVRASAGDAYFGGEDFTDAVAIHFMHLLDIHPTQGDAGMRAHIRQLAERAKMELSTEDEVDVTIRTPDGPRTLNLTREEFETIVEPLTVKLRLPLERALSDTGLTCEDIDKVLLVGGATRMPVIRRMVGDILSCEPEGDINPVHVVALGASIQSALVARHEALEDLVMTDVCPFTLGTEVALLMGQGEYRPGYFQPIIERNTTVPVSRVQRSRAVEAGQEDMTVKIYQGESPRTEDNVLLGQIVIPLPKSRSPNPAIEEVDIRYSFDISALLEVEVTVLSTGRTHRLVIEGQSKPMSREDVAERLSRLSAFKSHPAKAARNIAVLERLKAAFAMHLGEDRQAVQDQLDLFTTVLDRQMPQDIDLVRRETVTLLNYLDSKAIG